MKKILKEHPTSVPLCSEKMALFDENNLPEIEKLAQNYELLLKHFDDIASDPNMYFCDVGLKFNVLQIIQDKIVLGDLIYLLIATPFGQSFNRKTLSVAGGENDTGTTLFYDIHRKKLDVSLETSGFTDNYLVPAMLAIIVRYKMIVESDFDFYSYIPMSIDEVIETLKRKDNCPYLHHHFGYKYLYQPRF